jgi:hypothetical protein
VGDGSQTARAAPVPVVGAASIISVTAGDQSTCGLTASGAAYCWGKNYFGAVGDETNVDRLTPVAVHGGHVFTTLAVIDHACATTPDGDAYCWGYNFFGQIGNGTTSDVWSPVRVTQP